MRLKRFFIALVVLGVFLIQSASSLPAQNSSNEVIPLRLKAGMITEAEFPEKIANVTKGVSSEFLHIETLGKRMFLLPKQNFDSQLYVVTEDNVSYCLQLIMDGTQPLSRVKIKKPAELKHEPQSKEALNTIELMKALLSGKLPAGAAGIKLRNKEIFNNVQLRILADEVYELPQGVKAFVLTFENLMDKPIVVPIEHIELPGLMAVSVDSWILQARSGPGDKKDFSGYSTKVYMIVKESNR